VSDLIFEQQWIIVFTTKVTLLQGVM